MLRIQCVNWSVLHCLLLAAAAAAVILNAYVLKRMLNVNGKFKWKNYQITVILCQVTSFTGSTYYANWIHPSHSLSILHDPITVVSPFYFFFIFFLSLLTISSPFLIVWRGARGSLSRFTFLFIFCYPFFYLIIRLHSIFSQHSLRLLFIQHFAE